MNRKNVILSFVLTLSIFIVSAQSPGYGLKGGINLSNFGADAASSDTRIGLNIGGYLNRALEGDFAYQPEASISLEGDDDVSFTNLNVGVLGKYNLNELTFEFGPQLGFILSDDDSGVNPLNFTLGFGAGYVISENLVGGIRYNAGLSDLSDGPGKLTNNTFSFNIFLAL